ncbi:MAG: dienelactone hydrolase family protein [Thermomicrobiales bacterium]|nr:dienelactone hydrolase family protein [Thermomicrobiales bacterium]MCO5223283.1 dienelactone hydrolase family protein [Thermomicrobiales bacterium]
MCHPSISWPISGGAPTAAEQSTIDRGDVQLPIFTATPDGDAARAGVVLIHDINGVNDFYKDMAGRLAEAGYLTVLPELFVRQGPLADSTNETRFARMSALDKDLALEDILATVAHVRKLAGSDGPVGLIGFCMGGTLAMLSAGLIGGPDAAISFYGFPARRPGWPKAPMEEVDSIRVPLMLIVGDQDEGVGMDNMEQYESLLDAANKDYESITYTGVGHGFMTFDPEAESYSQAADAWTATLQFLDQQLGGNV